MGLEGALKATVASRSQVLKGSTIRRHCMLQLMNTAGYRVGYWVLHIAALIDSHFLITHCSLRTTYWY